MRIYKFLFLFAVLYVPVTHVFAFTEVVDDITTNTTWTVANSPYVITDTLTIAENAILTIEPGVVVKFDFDSGIEVDGTLHAVGATDHPIIFTSLYNDAVLGDTNMDGDSTTPSPFDWTGIYIAPGAQASFISTAFSYLYSGVLLDNAQATISNSSLSNSASGIFLFNQSALDMDTTVLKNISLRMALGIFDASVVHANKLTVDTISDQNGIMVFDGSSLSLSDSVVKDAGTAMALGSFNATLTLSHSKIAGGGGNGIALFDGTMLAMDHSTVSGFSHGAGIADYGSSTTDKNVFNLKLNTITGNQIGVALYDTGSYFSVSKNSIKNNTDYGVLSYAEGEVNFKNNYWGNPSGPQHRTNINGQGNRIYDISGYNQILFIPFLTAEPTEDACCSSVIFVPGFEGSRLYEKGKKGKLTQRWEPGIGSLTDVDTLMMDANGNSENGNIVTKDIIERTNYTQGLFNENLYKTFADLFRGYTAQNIIKEFIAFPYDWRLDVNDIAKYGTATDAGVMKLKDQIIAMANSTHSQTGKVTLIGHSNGGLLIKKTMALLNASGQGDLVDKVIFVASPQLGTPDTLAALLHGNNTKIGYGFVLDEMNARNFAQNMPGAYGLLPSKKLYEKMGDFIHFADESFPTDWFKKYGDTLSYAEASDFLTGGDGRSEPRKSQLEIPAVLNQSLIDKATALHTDIDTMTFPQSTTVYEIAGVGVPTVEGIKYESSVLGLGTPKHKLMLSCTGDKAVVVPSAVDSDANPYYVNLYSYFQDMHTTFDHATILENPEVLGLISNITTNTAKLTPHISNASPTIPECKFKLFGIFSPVAIDVYDSEGRHTGINQAHSTDNFMVIDTEIPNSNFITIGNEKYVAVPDTGEEYTVQLTGTGTGLFSMEVSTQNNTEITAQQSFVNLPVTPSMKADMAVSADMNDELSLAIDSNGDGVVDQTVTENTEMNPLSYLAVLKDTVLSLNLKTKAEKKLINKIDDIAKLIEKNKISKATTKLKKLLSQIELGKGIAKKMTDAEKSDLADKITSLLDSF